MMQTSESWALTGEEKNEDPPNSEAPACSMHFVM